MNDKRNVAIWFALVTLSLAAAALFNYLIDPLWCFSHSNALNNRQPGFNERQQKTNRAYFGGLEQYDTLLLGSSRTAYIDQHDFKGMSVFNYAADNMMPKEYAEWIEIAKTIKGGAFKTIIIGIDFFGTAENYDSFFEKYYNGRTPKDYLKETKRAFYRYTSLLSIDALKHSMESVKRLEHPTISDYDRNNVRHCSIEVSASKREHNIEKNIEEYRNPLLLEYRYRSGWKNLLQNLKERNPNTRFILFTTPVSEPFFRTFIIEGRHLDDYARWLRETIEVFGEVYHFMDLNDVTCNMNNFFDAHHVYAPVDRWLAHRVSGANDTTVPRDFGKLLTSDNIDTYLHAFRARLADTRQNLSQNPHRR
ncbi:hypothetical protein [Hydrogenimonas sp.]